MKVSELFETKDGKTPPVRNYVAKNITAAGKPGRHKAKKGKGSYDRKKKRFYTDD